jgi:scyllo-inositol 2-dehydrogenase (NADP+)
MTTTPLFPLIKAPVRTAVIGYGFAGRSFHSYLVSLATPGLALHGIAARDPQKREQIKAERGCRAYETFEEVIADPDVDLVVLATPSSTHAPLAVAALNAGKHVVTDKVMCLTREECDAMYEAADRNNRLLTVFHNRRLDGDYRTIKGLIDTGALGDVNWVEMAWQGFGAWGNWRGQAAMGGGKLYDLGAHLLDQILQLFPEPIEHVYCRMQYDFLPEKDIESEALVVVTFEGGKTGIIDVSSRDALIKPRFRVHGSKATLTKYGLDPQEDAMKAGDIDSAVEAPANYATLKSPQEEQRIPTEPGRWRSYYEDIATVLTEGAEPMVKPTEMQRLMAVLDAARESAQSGKTVKPYAP